MPYTSTSVLSLQLTKVQVVSLAEHNIVFTVLYTSHVVIKIPSPMQVGGEMNIDLPSEPKEFIWSVFPFLRERSSGRSIRRMKVHSESTGLPHVPPLLDCLRRNQVFSIGDPDPTPSPVAIVAPESETVVTAPKYSYVGCFIDNPDRVLQGTYFPKLDTMTTTVSFL